MKMFCFCCDKEIDSDKPCPFCGYEFSAGKDLKVRALVDEKIEKDKKDCAKFWTQLSEDI